MNKYRMDNEKLIENEIKIAYIRIITIIFALVLIFFFYPEYNRFKYLIGISVIAAYGIAVFPLIRIFSSKIDLLSIIITVMDISFISIGVSLTDLDSYISQLYFFPIIFAAFKFNFKLTVISACLEIIQALGASYIYHWSIGEILSFNSLIIEHFQWVFYIIMLALISGVISKEVGRERYEKQVRQDKIYNYQALIERFDLFTKKVNQASRILFFRDSKIEEFVNTIAGEIAHITNSKYVQFIIFDEKDKIEYLINQPEAGAKEDLGTWPDSEEFKGTSLFIINNYPYGVIFNNLESQPLFNDVPYPSKLARNMICGVSSLKTGKKMIIYAFNDGYEYVQSDLAMVQAFCLHVGFALENKERTELFIQNRVMESEITVTAEIQQTLFPKETLEFSNTRFGCFYSPNKFLSGDYVDYFISENGRAVCVIADIMGGGLSRGFLSLGIRSALRVIASEETDSAKILSRLNKHICRHYKELNCFVTMHIAVVDSATNSVNTSMAGHFGPLVWAGKEPRNVEISSGLALGIDTDAEYAATHFDLKSRDVLIVCFTDGIIEARNKEGRLFGKEMLRQAIEEYIHESEKIDIDEIPAKVKEYLYNFTDGKGADDDWSLLVCYKE